MSGGNRTQIYLSPIYWHEFDLMRFALGKLIDTIGPLIAKGIPSLEELKKYLRRCFRELKLQLSIAQSFDDVMNLVHDNCTIINIACLEDIVNHYNINEAKAHITDYKKKVDDFCEDIKMKICENIDFMTDPSALLKYETVEFIIGWKIDEHMLREIRGLLSKAFQNIAKSVSVRAINEGN